MKKLLLLCGLMSISILMTHANSPNTSVEPPPPCAPTAGFTYSSTDLMAMFTDISVVNGIPSWLWDFGDGNTSTMQNPTHTYTFPGVYTVCLITTDSCSSDTSCASVTITCSQPTAGFSNTSSSLMASFTDTSTSTSTINSWLWDFGDGNTSSFQNPTHTYAFSGIYTVCLIATNTCGSSDTACSSVTITQCNAPDAGFSHTPNGLTLDFMDTSTTSSLILSWLWDFGDGNTSSMQDPSHTYSLPGVYTVCLIVNDSCTSDTSCSSITVVDNANVEDHPLSSINLYPNPVQEVLSLDQLDPMTEYVIEIVNIWGQVIDTRRITGQVNWQLNTDTYTSGSYTIRIFAADRVVSKRFIKRE